MAKDTIRIETEVNTSGLDKFKKAVEDIKKSLGDGVNKAVKDLGKNLKDAFDPRGMREYHRLLKENEQELRRLQQAAQAAKNAGATTAGGSRNPWQNYNRYNPNTAVQGSNVGTMVNGGFAKTQIYGQGGGPGGVVGGGNIGGNVNAGQPPTPPIPPSLISSLTKQFTGAWAINTLMNSPAAIGNAFTSTDKTAFMNGTSGSNALEYTLRSMSGTNLSLARNMMGGAKIRNGYMGTLEQKNGQVLGIDAAQRIGEDQRLNAGGGLNDFMERRKPVEDIAAGFKKAMTEVNVDNNIGGQVGSALGSLIPGMGLFGGLIGSTMSQMQQNKTLGPTLERAGSAFTSIWGAADTTNPGKTIVSARTGADDVAMGQGWIEAMEQMKHNDPLLQMGFEHLSETAGSRMNYSRRNRGGYNSLADVGGDWHYTEDQAISAGTQLQEMVGTTRGWAGGNNNLINTMFKMMTSGMSQQGTVSGIGSFMEIASGQGKNAAQQSTQVKKDLEDLMARAFGRGIEDSQFREDIVEAVKLTSTSIGGRGNDILAQTMVSAFNPNTDSRQDLGNMRQGFQALQSAQQTGYFRNRTEPEMVQALGEVGINDPYLASTLSRLAPGEAAPKALVDYLGQDKADEFMRQKHGFTKTKQFLSSAGVPKSIRDAAATAKDTRELQKIMVNASKEDMIKLREYAQYSAGKGDFNTGEGLVNYLMNFGTKGLKGKIGANGDYAATNAVDQQIRSEKEKRNKMQESVEITNEQTGEKMRGTQAGVAGKISKQTQRTAHIIANQSQESIQDTKGFTEAIRHNMETMNNGLFRIIQLLNQHGILNATPVPSPKGRNN